MSVMIITLELSGSESIDNGLVRLASEYRAHDEERCHAVVQAALGLKLASGAILLVAWWLLWDRWLGGRGWRPELAEAVMFGVLGGVCGSFWRYCLAITQVYEPGFPICLP